MTKHIPWNYLTGKETQILESIYCKEKESGESYDYQTLEDWHGEDWQVPDIKPSALFDQMEDNGLIRYRGDDKETFITDKGIERLKSLRESGLGTACTSDFDRWDCFCQMY